jgi:hypothetical protein
MSKHIWQRSSKNRYDKSIKSSFLSDSSDNSNNDANGANLSMFLEHGFERRDSLEDDVPVGTLRGTHIF